MSEHPHDLNSTPPTLVESVLAEASSGSVQEPFVRSLDALGVWRVTLEERVRDLVRFLREQGLLDEGAGDLLDSLRQRLASEKLVVAFVAEFSRGKSELINAIFFADAGRRIMPASPGRTTMCPVELGWDPEDPPGLSLLPIETRLDGASLAELRGQPRLWHRQSIDVSDPASFAHALNAVKGVRAATVDEARQLGFWDDEQPADNPPMLDDGQVEIPLWRHAVINVPHPLLKRGLVVLDTPGLNAIGAEPELTVNLIPQAQAVVFILGADTGVTKSDLTIWREHLATMEGSEGTRFVVLNKIDTLWDELSTPAQIEAQMLRQCAETAQTLALNGEQVLALSAQKGLLAKVRGDTALLAQSRLPTFESLLGQQVLGARQAMLESAIRTGVGRVQSDAQRTIGVRRRELAEQMMELKGLRGKNHQVIRQMRVRVETEKADFDRSAASVLAVRSVHLRQLRDVFKLLGSTSIKRELAGLSTALREPGLKLGIKKSYAKGFDNLRGVVRQVQLLEGEIHSMLGTSFRQLNTEYGFSLQAADPPAMDRFEKDLDAVERSHLQYLGVGNMMQLARPEFAEKLVRALLARVRSIFETALGEIELWNKSTSGQLDAQLRERRRAYGRRIEAIQRIQDAAGGLDLRLGEIGEQVAALDAVTQRLQSMSHELLAARADAGARAEAAEAVAV